MPARSQSQRGLIFARRDQYGSKEKTPKKWKWIWDEAWENRGRLPERAKLVKEDLEDLRWERKDPYSTLGIGRKAQIEEWFKTYAPDAKYTIDDDLNIKVRGNLHLEGTETTKLPERLSIAGWLDLDRSAIKEFPENLDIGGNLWLRDTGITELPEGLIIGGDLYLKGTSIKNLRSSLKIRGNIYKDF